MLLALKLLLTPLLIGGATLVQRRHGAAAGGRLVGLPLTSGPVAAFLLAQHGRAFAATAARGTLVGTISEAAFCLAYALTSVKHGWAVSTAAATAAFLATTAVLRPISLPVPVWAVAVPAALISALLLLGGRERAASPAPAPAPVPAADPDPAPVPAWDLPARALVATIFVLGLTTASAALGATLSGLLSPLPIYAAVMIAFTHAHAGGPAARATTRGVLAGLFAFAAFFTVLAATLDRLAPIPAFAAAVCAALAVQTAAGRLRAPPRFSPR